jgi:hypothetical protein
MSKITLKPITYENQYYITSLNSGYDDVYVASNALIQAFFKKTIKNVRAIYLETKLKNKAKTEAETKTKAETEAETKKKVLFILFLFK